jgi:hypothetical protein
MITTNQKAHLLIKNKEVFKANNIFSIWHGNNYIVYSYGFHFPMYVYNSIENKWYENKDKYSVSTSKQQNQCRIYDENIQYIKLNTQELQNLIAKG